MKKRDQIFNILNEPHIKAKPRQCDFPGCSKEGKYRAPKSKKELDNYFWFCLEHVRLYNARWNFHAGLSQTEIEQQLRADTTWWRPTWPLGTNPSSGATPCIDFGSFGVDNWDKKNKKPADTHNTGWQPKPGSLEEEALAIFDLNTPVTKAEVKEKYKKLVKKNHPDTNGDDPDAEEKLKSINRAYSTLMACDAI